MPQPQPMDRRYYRSSDTVGLEIALLRKAADRNGWLVVTPERSICLAYLSQRKTYSKDPIEG
eukprot:11932913-Alexandrium_andersonii.AAC.1